MRLLFRENASKAEKIYTLCFIAFVGIVAYGFYNGFRPSDSVSASAVYLAIPGSLVFFVPLLLDRHPANKLPTYGIVKRFFVYALALVLCYLLAWIGVHLGFPALGTRLFGTPFADEYKVIAKGDGRFRWRDYCTTHAVHVQSLSSGLRTTVCPSEDFWAATKVGDTIFVAGHESGLGVLPEDLTLRR